MRTWTPFDIECMCEAMDLAQRGIGRVEPNPMVGCVLAKGRRIVGRGFHRRFGGPHAEVEALRDAGRRARGSTAYVTLEPCNHHGKTPPCTEALIRAGIRRVMIGTIDPNPLVSGKGIRRLRAAGISCKVGLLESAAKRLTAAFRTCQVKRRPYVILKWAQSIDGKIATRTGDSKWISSATSRRQVHEIRARVDAVLVGIGTVLADDPDLTARFARPKRVAARIVLDPDLEIPIKARLVRTARRWPTILVTRPTASRSRKALALRTAKCEVLPIACNRRGIRLGDLLKVLHKRGMTNVLVEGGGRVLGSFVEAGLADEARIFVAPKLIGGETAPGPLRNTGPGGMDELPGASCIAIDRSGEDICYTMAFG